MWQKLEANCFYLCFFLDFSKKRHFFIGYFSLFFDKEEQSKKIFCIINLVRFQVYRVEKVGIYLLPQLRKSSFYFSDIFLKSDILTQVLGFFGPGITLNILENNIFQIYSIRAFDWCVNCHTSIKKNVDLFFVRVPPCGQNGLNFFYIEV